MLEVVPTRAAPRILQQLCARLGAEADRFRSIEDLVARTGINREELSVLAEIGALSAFGHTRREALWQVERAIGPTGELFEEGIEGRGALVRRSPRRRRRKGE